MFRFLIISLALLAATRGAAAQDAGNSYGPFDAIAEGARNSENRRLSLIDSQLDGVDRLRSITVPVGSPRVFVSRDPNVAAVYPYGRRGVLGLRPQGYVVVRRAPVVVYRRTIVVPPPYPPGDTYGYAEPRELVRQPIGHESFQSGPDRWEYRPLYAEDDRRLDEAHQGIERNLLPNNDGRDVESRDDFLQQPRRSAGRQASADEPEELPEPLDRRETRRVIDRGAARDIARDSADGDVDRNSTNDSIDDVGQPVSRNRRDIRVPPPPEPDPPAQTAKPKTPSRKADKSKRDVKGDESPNEELHGPLLQDPSGAREF